MKKLNSTYIIALSKTRLIAEIEDNKMNVTNYNMIRCKNINIEATILYVRYDIKYETLLAKK